MNNAAPEITSEQEQQLKSTTLQEEMNAWNFVQSKPSVDRPWIAAGILSCMKKGYSLNRLTINWEARDLRYRKSE